MLLVTIRVTSSGMCVTSSGMLLVTIVTLPVTIVSHAAYPWDGMETCGLWRRIPRWSHLHWRFPSRRSERLPPEPQLHAGTARPAFHDTASEIGQALRVAVAAGTKPTVREPSLNEAYVLQPRFGHS